MENIFSIKIKAKKINLIFIIFKWRILDLRKKYKIREYLFYEYPELKIKNGESKIEKNSPF